MYKVILHQAHQRSLDALAWLLTETHELTVGVDLAATSNTEEIESFIVSGERQLLVTCLTTYDGDVSTQAVELLKKLRDYSDQLMVIIYTTHKIEGVPCEQYLLKNYAGHTYDFQKLVGNFLAGELKRCDG